MVEKPSRGLSGGAAKALANGNIDARRGRAPVLVENAKRFMASKYHLDSADHDAAERIPARNREPAFPRCLAR
jgi:hypothetical protein